ncbi:MULTISPECIES: transcriptional regulator CynR [Pseudomonas]|jgi:LysR family transcriptional regulator, cyn operon transcriptional activator|uniref:Cyn operon transcriptional activator n=2 Tax=Pseudomonas TaxID=286 RepID=A0A1L7NA89_PSEPU|nr:MULTISPECIES: transcriptional regulator CynR [Pseudomonas]ERT19806.1 transcriptional regulator [Pseudomonas putida SJ3]PTC00792.1 transcriptional regulator CynR [Thalassospira xiamenensis]EKT4450334.1 transcriptional regulator CynR [Pseudomonas putida]EKT4563275.1 transcriptional regulator CynR [Pseudomonas putida]MBH3450332.1 transcriptional regulator CynR [Pseudomonas putida]
MLARHIQYFIAVANHRSFTRAAAALHVSQPALSQQVRQLEESLGTLLFDRSGRTTRLTDAGEVYLRYAKRAAQELQEAKRAIDDLGDLSRGSLRVGVTPTFTSYLVGPLVEAFYGRYPNITLVVREIAQEAMEELLLADEVDVGIAFDNGHHLDLEAQALLVETLALVVGKHHPLATTGSIGLEALNSESLILLSAEFATREQIDSYCRQHNIRPHVQVEANTISALIEVVSRTTLSTLLPATIAQAHEQLVAIELDPQRLQRTAVLMQRKGVYQTAAARAFVELAMKVAKQLESPGRSVQRM